MKKENGSALLRWKATKRNARVSRTRLPELSWRAAAETNRSGCGKVGSIIDYSLAWIYDLLVIVLPDADIECMGVLMEHSQDVKSVAWHPNEEVSQPVSFDSVVHEFFIKIRS